MPNYSRGLFWCWFSQNDSSPLLFALKQGKCRYSSHEASIELEQYESLEVGRYRIYNSSPGSAVLVMSFLGLDCPRYAPYLNDVRIIFEFLPAAKQCRSMDHNWPFVVCPFESSQGSLYRPEKHGNIGN